MPSFSGVSLNISSPWMQRGFSRLSAWGSLRPMWGWSALMASCWAHRRACRSPAVPDDVVEQVGEPQRLERSPLAGGFDPVPATELVSEPLGKGVGGGLQARLPQALPYHPVGLAQAML